MILFYCGPFPYRDLVFQARQKASKLREFENEDAVEVGEARERLDFLNALRGHPFHDDFDLGWVHAYTVSGDDHFRVLRLSNVGLAFVDIHWESCFFQTSKHFANVLDVFFVCVAEFEDIILICRRTLIEEFAQRIAYEALKGSRCVAQVE